MIDHSVIVPGTLHHVEVYVSDLQRTKEFWGWLLESLGYSEFQKWDSGISWKLGSTYLVFVQAEKKYLDVPYHRKRPGLNHLAFYAESNAHIDSLTSALKERGVTILYADKHPIDKSQSYTVFFEDPDRIKVELVAPVPRISTVNNIHNAIYGARISLEPIKLEHTDEMFEVLNAPEIYKFILDEPPISADMLRERYQRLAVGHSPDGAEQWLNWVIRNISSCRLIGYVQATVHPLEHLADIAYVLHPSVWGLGLAEEACHLMIQMLRLNNGVTNIRATIDTENFRSIKLMRRLGFSQTDIKIGSEIIRGSVRNEIVMEASIASTES